MKRLLVLAMVALCAPALTAGTNTFGLFYNNHACGGCGCPGPWNAFSPTNCCYSSNAAGCTAYPGCAPVGGCGPQGCGHQWHGFFKHWGHPQPFAYDLPLPYPCGALMAFTGTPGGLGCGDPYNGCGSAPKHPWLSKLGGCCHGATSCPPEHLCDYFKGWGGHGLGHKLGIGHVGGSCGAGGCASGLVEAPLSIGDAIPTPAPAAMAAPAAPMYQPVSYQPAYYPQGYYYYGYYPGYGYYPAFGYPMGR